MSDRSSAAQQFGTFQEGVPRYSQATFGGRFRHFLDVADPRCLAPKLFFNTSIDESVLLLKHFKAGTLPAGTTEEQLWMASKVKISAVHPDTGETILPPFRMCGYAVFGSPIILGMLTQTSTVATVFWQSVNQSHNAGVNFSNRNASSPVTNTSIMQGFAGAVASSVLLAVGLNKLVAVAPVAAATRAVLAKFTAYPAVAMASSANMLLMRRTELETGINVFDADGVDRGKSKAAAAAAIKDTLVTRVVLPAPLLLLPPLSMMFLDKFSPLFRRFPRARLPVEATACFFSFVFGLPFAIALFPQQATSLADSLEPEFRVLCDKAGAPVTHFTYNKGL